MRFLITLFLIGFIFFRSHGQETSKQDLFNPFSILIFKPDNATIADSLKVYADSIEQRHRDGFFISIENMEKLRELGIDDQKEQYDIQIQEMKSRENEIYKFKYYHSIAEKTLFELRQLFNANYWESNYISRVNTIEGETIDPSDLITHDFNILRKHYKVDYTVTFENVHTDRRNGTLTLKYVVTLFSRKENKVILKKEIEGNAPVDNYKLLRDIFPPGNQHEFGIHCENYLDCVILSAVRFSTEELFKVISERQKK